MHGPGRNRTNSSRVVSSHTFSDENQPNGPCGARSRDSRLSSKHSGPQRHTASAIPNGKVTYMLRRLILWQFIKLQELIKWPAKMQGPQHGATSVEYGLMVALIANALRSEE